MMMHLNDPVPDLRQIQPDAPESLVRVIEKCLAKEPVQRFQTAAEVTDALKKVIIGQQSGVAGGVAAGVAGGVPAVLSTYIPLLTGNLHPPRWTQAAHWWFRRKAGQNRRPAQPWGVYRLTRLQPARPDQPPLPHSAGNGGWQVVAP